MNKTLIALIAAIIALGVAIYFFQGRIITTHPTDTTPAASETKTQTQPAKVLPPTMEDGTVYPDTSTSSSAQ
jgi:hypothetical protein